MAILRRETPWAKDQPEQCYFYHTMHYPDGETKEGAWTIPDFSSYIGGYDLAGKTVPDVGTASGFLAFNAEIAGAEVTGLDAATTDEFRHMPFASAASYRDITTSRQVWTTSNLIPIKRSWWYNWHRYGSKAACLYAPIEHLYGSGESFDVVLAGAIIEHLSDPLYAIGAWTRVAKEAVIIPFTEVADSKDLWMEPIVPLEDPSLFYIWWRLSRGLWDKVFDNLGFDVRYATTHAVLNQSTVVPQTVQRPTIIATRRPGTWAALNGG